MMKKIILAFLLVSPLARADLSWNGSMNTRFRAFDYNDGLSSKNADGKDLSKQHFRSWDYRGNLLGKAQSGAVEGFAGLRLSNTPVNDYNNFNRNADGVLKLEYAGVRYTWKADDLTALFTIGRQDTPFYYDKLAQHVFDTDMRWDGFNEEVRWHDFGFIMNQFVWAAKSGGVMGASSYSKTEASDAVASTQSAFAVVYGFSPYAKFKLNDEISTTLSIAYYNWSNADNLTNTIHGGYNSSTLNPNATTGTVNLDSPKFWHVYNQWSLPFKLHAVGEWTMNKKTLYSNSTVEADRKSWTAGAGYGVVKAAGDFSFDYFYMSKGIASTLGAITNGGIKPDNKGHLFYLRYSPWTKITTAASIYFMEEKAGLEANGTASTQHVKQNQIYLSVGTAI